MVEIRTARLADLPQLLAIFNDVIDTSTAVYLDEPVSLKNRQAWFKERQRLGYPVLVAIVDGCVAGFSSFGDYRAYHGYRFTVEHSVHVAAPHRGKGIGGALISALLPIAKNLGKHVMLGVVDAQNAGSLALHAKLGFVEVARMPEVGYKFGRWLEVVIMQRQI